MLNCFNLTGMKSTSIFFFIFVLFSSCLDSTKALGQESSIRDGYSFYEKSELIHSIRIKNTSYQLYENLICIAHDTIKYQTSVDSYSTKSLSIFQNHIFKKELFEKDLFIDRKYLGEALNAVFVSTIRSDEEKTLLQIDFDFSPSAPGDHTISFIQFQEHDFKESRVCTIIGSFNTDNGEIDGVGWSGYFAFDLPHKLTEREDKLDLDIDSLKIHRENDFHFLKIKDGVRFPPSVCELEMTVDPFGNNPSATTTVTLNPNTKVTLIYMAVENLIQPDYYFFRWVKIKVSDQEGWIENGNDVMKKIGCQAAG